jgi:hypothetical protein
MLRRVGVACHRAIGSSTRVSSVAVRQPLSYATASPILAPSISCRVVAKVMT